MKPFAKQGVCLLLLIPAWAFSADQRPPSEAAENAVAVMPISMVEPEARSHPRLRDSLRQPHDDEPEISKPYRLSVEERHRLREQLRGVPGHAQTQK